MRCMMAACILAAAVGCRFGPYGVQAVDSASNDSPPTTSTDAAFDGRRTDGRPADGLRDTRLDAAAEASLKDAPGPDRLSPDLLAPDSKPPPTWDVQGVFYQTQFSAFPPQIFGQNVAGNQVVQVKLDASDDTYTEPNHTCPGYYTNVPKARTWDIERKKVSGTTFRLLVRGQSDADCGKGTPSVKGEVSLNPQSSWKIIQVVKCSATVSCNVSTQNGVISWHSGKVCSSCCACPDAAGVDIEVVVTP